MSVASSRPSLDTNPFVYLPEIVAADYAKRTVTAVLPLIHRYLETRPNENFKTLELSLRGNNCWSRLFAVDPAPGITAILHNTNRAFVVALTTEDPVIAKTKVFLASGDEQTNLKRLLNAGFPSVNRVENFRKIVKSAGENFILFPAGEELLRKAQN